MDQKYREKCWHQVVKKGLPEVGIELAKGWVDCLVRVADFPTIELSQPRQHVDKSLFIKATACAWACIKKMETDEKPINKLC